MKARFEIEVPENGARVPCLRCGAETDLCLSIDGVEKPICAGCQFMAMALMMGRAKNE